MTLNTERPIAPSGFRPNLRTIPGTGGGGDVGEYIQPERSGLESGFYTTPRGLPWHVTLARRLNTPELMKGSDRKLSVEEALELAEMGWKVAKAPMYALLPDGTYVPVANRFVTYREDTNAILGSNLSGGFKVVQQGEAFSFGDYLLDTPGCHIESAGSLFGGRAVFVSFEVPDEVHVAGDPSDYRLFLLVSNGHDGNHRLRLDITVERALCRNTVRIGQQRALSTWSIRHSSGLDGKVQAAKTALGLTTRYVEQFSADASALAGKTLLDRQVDDILSKLLPLTELQAEAIAKDPTKVTATPQAKVLSIYRDSPSVEPIRGTAYGLFNAVTEYADHARSFRDADNRAEALMFDDGSADIKNRAWALLTAAAK